MSQPLRVALIVGIALAGCRPIYKQPSLNEPHAVVKVRIQHHTTPGPNLNRHVRLNDEDVEVAGDTFALRVRPQLSNFALGSIFSHVVPTPRTRQVAESYQCGGYGSTTRYCTRYRTEYYTEYVTVVDAKCGAHVQLIPRVGETYLLQYDFYADSECALKCFVQKPRNEGEFDLVRCDGT